MANVRAYFDYLTGPGGLSPIAAAGILGNIQKESNFDPSAFNAKEGAEGLGQWRFDRRDAMRAHVAASSLPPALAQLDFMVKEMGPLRDRLNKAPTPEDAARENDRYRPGAAPAGPPAWGRMRKWSRRSR